ncbi:type I-E CRISPR-associated protein Cas6/Cse3/CasE [Nordella sp. HKS 07]|uniref:type I-E CRISPR-associated protein Cas6/Cse3/CasE n=1 Tax=Nordella sp. HKS 07 TaxID=2712222 RepID=UPI0013E1C002|nr:type I-E CRISPR-associated protein Cas6/Cse3/CasE [Nordella sp. HKS 07]QIG50143.1 type I-E CRISPR-associated protein Cas6/Cse3/CasE [Nordella sp. HKS 07]
MTAPSLFLSRATLKADPSIAALGGLLLPDAEDLRLDADHRLMWSLFADDADAQRDFLYRRDPQSPKSPKFYILSHRPPAQNSVLFDVETKPFEPHLTEGDILLFSLLANPTVSQSRPREDGRKPRGRRHDVVMAELSKILPGSRAEARRSIIESAGRGWLERQGAASGFVLDSAALTIDGYDQKVITSPAGKSRKGQIRISLLSFEGQLRVVDPAAFLDRLAKGFGRARAFGCGLMLIRRA